MCNIYQSTSPDDIPAWFKAVAPTKPYAATVAPLKDGPFVKAGGEVEVGQWGMIPGTSKTRNTHHPRWSASQHQQRPQRDSGHRLDLLPRLEIRAAMPDPRLEL